MMEDDEGSPEPEQPVRGTASAANPFAGESPPQGPDPNEDPTITINAPDGSARVYLLSETVKRGYERMYEEKFDNGPTLWYEMWWEGTELVIEFEGYWRDESLRPSHEDESHEDTMERFIRGGRRKMDGIPRAYHPARDGHRPSMRDMMEGNYPRGRRITKNLSEHEDGLNYLDNGTLPVYQTTRIDIQMRADEHPLQVEDLFVRPWSSEEGQQPLNSEHEDGEVSEEMFEVEDFRDYTDGSETVSRGERGNRFHL